MADAASSVKTPYAVFVDSGCLSYMGPDGQYQHNFALRQHLVDLANQGEISQIFVADSRSVEQESADLSKCPPDHAAHALNITRAKFLS